MATRSTFVASLSSVRLRMYGLKSQLHYKGLMFSTRQALTKR